MASIRLLSEDVINQIAAGEVVERPASVLKELAENAIDAGATSIRVRARGGGVELLEVVDDGRGMAREDAERCLLRHATSKLENAEGLLSIATLGFRGEALAAIAAVSRLTLSTLEAGAAIGTRLLSEGGGVGRSLDAPPVPGTSVRVEDLFFNVPARRKFLRREETEVRHLEDVLLRLALGHEGVGFALEVDGEPRLQLAANASSRERLTAAVGQELHDHLLPLEERRLGVRVEGWVAAPEMTLSNARGIYFFVNRRYVRDRGLIAALQRALGPGLVHGRQPVAAIFLTLDPSQVDVNVHPQKTEVRFVDARGVQEAVHAAVTRSVREAPWNAAAVALEGGAAEHYANAVHRFLERARNTQAGEGLPWMGSAPAPAAMGEETPAGFFRALRPLGAFGAGFQAMEGPGGTLVVIDLHAARERIHLAAFLRAGRGEALERGLASETVTLPEVDRRRMLAAGETLEKLGVELEPFGGDAIVVRALPAALVGQDTGAWLGELAAALSSTTPPDAAGIAALLACHAARREPGAVSADEVRRILERMEDLPSSPVARHARVVVLEVTQHELRRRTGGIP